MMRAYHLNKTEYKKIPLSLGLLGIEHEQEPVYRTKGVPMHQWFYCDKGSGELLIQNHRYVIRENTGFFIKADEPHEYHALSDDWTLSNVGFRGVIAGSLLNALQMTASSAYTINTPELFKKHLLRLKSIDDNAPANKNMLFSQELYCLLTELSSDIKKIKFSDKQYGNQLMDQLVNYLEVNYAHDVSLDELSEVTGRTPEYLCRIFKEYTGFTIINYLNNIRLLHAQIRLIQEPSVSIVDIASDCGFRSSSYFGRVFHKRYGMTPGECRIRNSLKG